VLLIRVVAPSFLATAKALVVQIDHENRRGRIKLRRQKNREPDRPRAHNGNRIPWLHLPVQDATFEACRQNIAKHHEGFFVSVCRETVQTPIGMWDAHVLGLGSVEGVAQNPAAMSTMGIHTSPAEIALQAGSDARDYNFVSNVELRDARSDLFNDANALVAENAALDHRREISLQNMKIGPTDRGSSNSHDGIVAILNGRARFVLPRAIARAVIDQRFHRRRAWSSGIPGRQVNFSGRH
jgi:hypothetical protein